MTKAGKAAVVFVFVASLALIFDARSDLRDSTDGQAAFVIPFLIFWTILALGGVVLLDYLARTIRRARRARRDIAKPS